MIFISYHYNDVQISRTIAEILIGNMNKSWFAEYEIPLEVFIKNNEDDIKQHILTGIENSNCAIIFTNSQWAKSKWCQFEYTLIKNKGIPFLQVCTEVDGTNTDLISLESFYKFRHGKTEGLIDFIAEKLGLILHRDEKIASDVTHSPELILEYGSTVATVRIGPYKQQRPKGCLMPFYLADEEKTIFSGRYFGAEGVIDAKPSSLLININPDHLNLPLLFPQSMRIESFEHMMRLRANDSEIQKYGRADLIYYREFAKVAQSGWYEAHRFEEKGLHVCHYPNRSDLVGSTQMALTSIDKKKTNEQKWHRFYHLKILDKISKKIGEITLSCVVAINTPDDEKGFSEFCRLTPLFDSISQSILYHGSVNMRF